MSIQRTADFASPVDVTSCAIGYTGISKENHVSIRDSFCFIVFEDILHFAIQNKTYIVEGGGCNCFSLLDPLNRIGRKAVLEDKLIFRQSFSI